ncbi:hypothetical protein EON82_09470 [bacterium]|nr:MAG: hypothetical protein EON82_09470 [bacterium]
MYRRLGIDKRVDLEPEAAAWYADLAREFGTPQEADRAARSVIRWTPEKGWPKGKRLFAWAHLVAIDSSPNIEVALRHAERALTFDPSLPSVHLTISLLLGRPDQVKESREAFAKAMSLVKSGPWEGWIALAWYWQRKERPQEVLSALQEAFRRVPATDVRAWLRLRRAARTLNSGVLDMRRESPALRRLEAKAFERALQVVQAIDGEALVWLAEAVDKKEDAPKAFALAMAARRVTAPTQTRRYVRIAQSFIRWKRKAEAAEMLRAALNVTSPQDTGSYRDIAWGYRSLGDETKAIRMLREALRYAKSADQTRIETDLATLEGRWGGLGGSIGFNPSVLDLTVGPVGFR